MQSKDIVLEVQGVTKRFPGVLANDDVSLKLHKGEILALLGENGAGKSTLMNIIYGLYHADAGTVKLNGQEARFVSSREAIHSGIGMVHQHFQLIPVMTVAENVVLGEEITSGSFLDMEQAARRVRELSEQYGLAVDPDALVEDLPVGAQQRVEIIKALYRDASILILDEPTAVLTPQEVQELFKVMRDLAARGVSIIFITHKLKEVLAIAHRIVVMRDGAVVGTATPDESTQESLAAMMVGREVLLRVEKPPATPQDVVLEIEGVKSYDDREHLAVADVSLQVRAGEILGVAGVQGNGQTELVEVLTGLRSASEGRIKVNGIDLTNASPREITASGTGHVPEDRHRYGMVDDYTVAENLVLNTYYAPPYGTAPSLRSLPVVGAG
ncbi:MAG: ABC transporter ATP-binding protein, partial [Anaerolineae bacterium]|nr:ABC transporter ATP-binding protein [Anaerolineae bacterium]